MCRLSVSAAVLTATLREYQTRASIHGGDEARVDNSLTYQDQEPIVTESSFPSVTAYGNISKALRALTEAPTPPRFTQDFLSTKLAMPGGSARPVIPFFKKAGLLSSDGTPTELYNEFRNGDLRGGAAAKALRNAYSGLYSYNEYLHDLDDQKLKNVIVQATGLKEDSTTAKSIFGSFKALKDFADFDGVAAPAAPKAEAETVKPRASRKASADEALDPIDLRLGYTINLNLPATTDIEVFNAIFSSLRTHLLRSK
jgi:hypothetical protein